MTAAAVPRPWSRAMRDALYGTDGFFLRHAPAEHFRTSVTASPVFAQAVEHGLALCFIQVTKNIGGGTGCGACTAADKIIHILDVITAPVDFSPVRTLLHPRETHLVAALGWRRVFQTHQVHQRQGVALALVLHVVIEDDLRAAGAFRHLTDTRHQRCQFFTAGMMSPCLYGVSQPGTTLAERRDAATPSSSVAA